MRKIIITITVAIFAALSFSLNAGAQSFTIKRMICKETTELFLNDALYIRYRVNGGPMMTYPSGYYLKFQSGNERSDVLTVNAKRDDTIYLEFWEENTFLDDVRLNSFSVKLDWPTEKRVEITGHGARYYIDYVIK